MAKTKNLKAKYAEDVKPAMKEKFGYTLIIDGACSPAVIGDLFSEGADGFVLGTSALFGKGEYAEVLAALHGQKRWV